MCQAEANEFAFEGDGPYRCHATTARIQAQRRHADADGEPDPALLWGDRLKPGR